MNEAIEKIKERLNKLNEHESIEFDAKKLNLYQAARNSFFKSEKLFYISHNRIIRLKDLKDDYNGSN